MTKEQISEINALFEKYPVEPLKRCETPIRLPRTDENFDALFQGPPVRETMAILSKGTIHAIILMMMSCTVQNGGEMTSYPDGRINKKHHLYASLGGKAKGVSTSPESGEILEHDDSITARSFITAAGTMYSAGALLSAQESNNALEATKATQIAKTDRASIASATSIANTKTKADAAVKALELAPKP